MPRYSKLCLFLRVAHQTLSAPLPSLMRATCPNHSILVEFITRYLVRSADHEASGYVVFFIGVTWLVTWKCGAKSTTPINYLKSRRNQVLDTVKIR